MTEVPLVTKMYVCGVFFQGNLRWLFLKKIQVIIDSVKSKKSYISWKMFEMEFKFSKFSSIRSKRCVEISPSQQNDWVLRVQHTLCITYNVNRHLSKKMKKVSV